MAGSKPRKLRKYSSRYRLVNDPNRSGRFILTQKQIDTMRKHRINGASIKAIADVMGVSVGTVHEQTKDIVPRMTIVKGGGVERMAARLSKS